MRVVFMGTPDFAVPSLEALALAHDVAAVYSRPDAVSGRGRATRPSPVAAVALRLGIPLHRPSTLKDPAAVAEIAALAPDLLVVAAYGMILPQSVLDVPTLGAVNVHASILPRWRGAAPIQRAILAGDEEVGISIMRMEAGLDTGPYFLQASRPAGNSDAVALSAALAALGAATLLEALPSIADGTVAWTAQDESHVTYAEKISKDDVAVSPEMDTVAVLRRVRASSPAAPCRITVGDRNVTLLEAFTAPAEDAGAAAPGCVASCKTGVFLGVSDGVVLVTRLKPQGKGEMGAADWARGVQNLDTLTWNGLR